MRGMKLNPRKSCIDNNLGASRKPCDNGFDILLRHRLGFPELTARQAQFDGRRCFGTGIDNFLALPAGVANLCPKMISRPRTR
jgi:hypothetical protein